MRRIALHEYLSQIEGLLDDNRLPEAAAQCHFVLHQYPRHIATYRLFGRALLEQQLYEEAIDVFERLLSADPEDLISHAGLALAYGESRDLERAIWHMERAYEIDPYNRAVQDELRKLYIARDGDAPPRLTLTRVALARLHLRGAIYRQAVKEFSQLVAKFPERGDLQLALAETLYLDLKLSDAASICQELVATLPFCVKANAILADVLLREERVDEAREYLRRVQSLTMFDRAHLDPDTTLGRTLGNARISLPEIVEVEVLEDPLTFSRESAGAMNWSDRQAADLVAGEDVPDWLQEVGSPDPLLVPVDVDQPGVGGETEQLEPADWLDEAVAAENVDPFDEGEAAAILLADDVDAESYLSQESSITGLETDAAEALIGQLETSGEHAEADQSPDVNNQAGQDGGKLSHEEKSHFGLDDLRAQIDSVDDNDPAMADAEVPDWLDELSEPAEEIGELPSWLHEVVGLETDKPAITEQGGLEATPTGVDGIGDDQEASRKEFTSTDSTGDIGRVAAEDERDVFYSDSEIPESDSDTSVPDWLLEGDDVLEELPEGLIHAEAPNDADERSEGDDTATWLDELTAQLMGQDDSLSGEPEESSAFTGEDNDDLSVGNP